VLYSYRAEGDHAPTFVSDSIRRLLGYEPREYLQGPGFWLDRVHPDDLPRVTAGLARLPEAGEHACEYRFRHKDGAYRWVEDRARLVRGADGTPLEVVGSWADAGPRRRAEEARREAEQRLERFLEAGSDWLWETDEAHRFTLDTDDGRKSGVVPDRLLGRTRWEFAGVPDPYADPRWRAHLADLEARRPFRGFEYVAPDDAGRPAYFHVSGAPVLDGDGAFRGYRGTACNVTERRRAEEARRETERRLEDAVESISEGFALFDAEDRLVICNRRYAEVFFPGREDLPRPGVPYARLLAYLARDGGLEVAGDGPEDGSRAASPGVARRAGRSSSRWATAAASGSRTAGPARAAPSRCSPRSRT
jgi:PAS domain S-box-containing protein